MDIEAYRNEIQLKLTGGLLDLELDDITIDRIIQSCLRELQRYICSTTLMTIPYSPCIDLSDPSNTNNKPIKISSISRIYRAEGFAGSTNGVNGMMDPMQVSMWQLMSGSGTMYNFQDYVYNYGAWNSLLQIRNTTSTDLVFRYDKYSNKLYVNVGTNTPTYITIEYIPRFDSVEDIISDYWTDILVRMCVATAKITVGRIRTRYKENGALWSQDGDQILQEGTTELKELRDKLEHDTMLMYPID